MKESIDIHKVFASSFEGVEALAYGLSKQLADGHICLDTTEYSNLLSENKDALNPFFTDSEAYDKQCKEGKFVSEDPQVLKPFLIQDNKAYLQRYYFYETAIIQHLERIAKNGNLKIITGGPGTGKTYSVSTALVDILKNDNSKQIALTAPTGKAAVRMNESIRKFAENPQNEIPETIRKKMTDLRASTLHRLLGSISNSVFFRYNEKNKLPYDVVIVDECSMIDGAMMAKLLMAIDDNTKLYLLGDKDQLASVDAGSVFGDICHANNSSIISPNLEIKTKSWRFDKDKGIGMFSREVIKGCSENIISKYLQDNQLKIDTEYSKDLFRKYALLYLDYIKEPDIHEALKKLNNIRFLCVTRENKHSVKETNREIEKILKAEISNRDLFYPKEGFYHNQPIIVTKNNYDLDVFNGDVGIIRLEDDKLMAYFEQPDGKIHKISAGYLNEFQTVFAMTIHKSQGSEFDKVVVILPENEAVKLLTRELLYTGVTRAINYALIQSSETTLMTCISKQVARSSGLTNRLNSIKNE